MSEPMRKIAYYENVLEFKENTNSPLLRSDVKNWSLCRVCLDDVAEDFDKMCVIGMDGVLLSVPQLLFLATGQLIDALDRLPQMICKECLNKLSTLYYFQQQVKRATVVLQRLLVRLAEGEDQDNTTSTTAMAPAVPIESSVNITTVADADCSSAHDELNAQEVKEPSEEEEADLIVEQDTVQLENDNDMVQIYSDDVDYVVSLEVDNETGEFDEEVGTGLHMMNADDEEEGECHEEFYVERDVESSDELNKFKLASMEAGETDIYLDNEHNDVDDERTKSDIDDVLAVEWKVQQNDVDSDMPTDKRKQRFRNKQVPVICLICNICNQVYQKQSELIQHCSKLHPNEKAYKCDICDSGFAHMQSLTRHRLTHTPELYGHVCSTCDKAFLRSDDLKRHMRIHTGQRPYSCTVCEKAFKQHSELNEHQLTHLKEKLFKCDICGHRLSSRNGLYLHKKVHAGIKKYQCSECAADGCERRFLTNSELRSHRNVHLKQKRRRAE